METFGSTSVSLWHEEDGFFYDVLVADDGTTEPLRVRSMVGLLPLLAVGIAPEWVQRELPDFTERLRWLRRNRAGQISGVVSFRGKDGTHTTLSVVEPERYARLLTRLLDEEEFLAPHGIRSLSAAYRGGFTTSIAGQEMSLAYDPGESTSWLFGGNSNWRGPIWLPVNVLLVDALRTYAEGAGADHDVEYPTGSGHRSRLVEVADDLESRLISLFRPGPDGRRPSDQRDLPAGPLWTAHPTCSEYFHGDTGVGLGASHQTGWTALVAHLICTR
jgi:hypothetical protein